MQAVRASIQFSKDHPFPSNLQISRLCLKPSFYTHKPCQPLPSFRSASEPLHTVHICFSPRRPYGFLERFDPNFTPNTTDLDGKRYTYRAQPGIGHWNSAQLANSLIAAGLIDLVRTPFCLM